MINKKEYQKPLAEVTVFECADVITFSKTLKDTPIGSGGKSYVSVGTSSWSDGFGQSQ